MTRQSLPPRVAAGNTFEPVATLIRGVLYPSQGAAAIALGVSQASVFRAMEEGRLDTLGLHPRGPRAARRVCINGVWFPSQRKAAAHFGMPQQEISRLVAKHGDTLTLTEPGKVQARAIIAADVMARSA